MRTNGKVAIRQRDSSDCGPACIASVLAHYGIRVPVARIRQVAGTDKLGTSMWGMVRTLEKFDFETRGLKGSAEHLDKLPLPFIAHVEQTGGVHHYVCVYGIHGKHLRVMDPSEGKMQRWSHEDFRRKWSGAVVAMVRKIQDQTFRENPVRRNRIISLLRPVWKPVLQAIFAAVIYTLLGLSTSLYIGKLADHVFITRNTGLLNLMSITMILITLVMIYMFAIRNLHLLKTGQVIDNQLITSYYRYLFRLPQRFFDGMKTGEIISRINDAIKIRGFINDAAIGILVNFLILFFSFALMFILHWKLALMMLILIPVYSAIYILFNRRNKKIERKAMERTASLESQLVESLEATAHIKQQNLEGIAFRKAEVKLNRLLDTVYTSGLNSITAMGGTELVNRLFTVILLWVGSGLVISYSITPGKLLTFYALIGYFTGPVSGLIGSNKVYQNALIAADRLFEIFHLEPEEVAHRPSFPRDEFGDIVFRNLSFAYGSRGTIFRNLDLTIRAGKVTAITGPSGSGKSTVASLVQHLYFPDEGSISINGYDTRYFSLESIRSMIGVVPQQVRFLTGSILENIAPGQKKPDVKRILHLLKALGLLPLIESLPGGLESTLIRNGTNLSGGERQRLALVRALYKNPALLILDEATSSLDPVSEVLVNRLLLSLKECSQTMLLITHHPEQNSLADFTFTMDASAAPVP
jgi:ATP-binding cassette subfamily B protein